MAPHALGLHEQGLDRRLANTCRAIFTEFASAVELVRSLSFGQPAVQL